MRCFLLPCSPILVDLPVFPYGFMLSSTQDTTGPMGKSVYDIALLLETIAGVDELDNASEFRFSLFFICLLPTLRSEIFASVSQPPTPDPTSRRTFVAFLSLLDDASFLS